MSIPSQKKKAPILWTQVKKAGHVPVRMVSYVVGVDPPASTNAQPNCSCSSGTESARLNNLLERKIARRLRQQKEVHKIDKELGDMMRVLRNAMGITLAALAYKTDLPFKLLYDIEQGTRSACLPTLHIIFKQYGIDIAPIACALKK